MLEWIILLMLGFMFSILRDNREVVYAQLDKIRFANKEVYSNNTYKYEKESGLRFEPLDDDDSIQDFQFDNKKEIQEERQAIIEEYMPQILEDGLYGYVEGENLFSISTIKEKRLGNKVTMDIQMLATPKVIETELEGCPPIIARHFFGRDYVDSFTI